jgi:DNA-binding LytR/AlgR family response regulator
MNAFVVWRIGGMHDYGAGDSPSEIRVADLSVTTQVQTSPMVDEASTEARTEPDGINAAAKQSASRSENSGFLARLPTRLGRDIVFVEAQEHYLRVATRRGEHLLLQGLTHAILELEENGFDGIQIHRSVWVAWKHVENVDVRPGTVSVFVSTGVCWKISRRRAKAFLDAWRKRLT